MILDLSLKYNLSHLEWYLSIVFFFVFSERFFMNLWPKKKKLVRPKKTFNAKHEAEYRARLKTDAENGQPIA